MSYRPWEPGECCGICSKAGEPDLFDGGMLACGGSGRPRWVCSRNCFDIANPPPSPKEILRKKLNETLLCSSDTDELLSAIREIAPIADEESHQRLTWIVDRSGYRDEIREAARKAMNR